MQNINKNTKLPIGSIVEGIIQQDDTILCNGNAINRITYSDLFNVIGTTFGIGNGTTTFNLPDFRAETLRGFDEAGALDAGRVLNSFQDESCDVSTLTATSSSDGAHGHTYATNTTGSHSHTYANNYTPGSFAVRKGNNSTTTSKVVTSSSGNHYHNFSQQSGGIHNHTVAISDFGDSETMSYNIALNYYVVF